MAHLLVLLMLITLLALSALVTASPEEDMYGSGFDDDGDADMGAASMASEDSVLPKEKARMDDETLPLVLAQLEDDQDCREAAEKVLLALAEQSELDEACSKMVYAAFQQTPMGQLQAREHQVTTLAGIVRLTPRCQKQFKKQPEGEEPVEPSDECKDALQKQQQAMNQWVAAVTFPKYSNECKQQIKDLQGGHGHLTVECVQEMKTIKPAAFDTLDTQTETMQAKQAEERVANAEKRKARQAQDAVREEEHQKQRTVRKEKKSSERLYGRLFMFFWTLVVGGGVVFGWKYYNEHPELHKSFSSEPDKQRQQQEDAQAAEEAAAQALPLSKRKQKLEAREAKRQSSMQNARR